MDAPHFASSAHQRHKSLARKRPVASCRARSNCCWRCVPVRCVTSFGPVVSQQPATAVPDSSGASRRLGSEPRRLPDVPSYGLSLQPRVLIVEDHDTTREMYAWCMRAAGWLVAEAVNGEAALYAAVLFEPDVIVMDLRLPVLEGIEVTRRLKETELTRHIPIVACSALDHAARDAKNAGCSAFVTKPCPPDHLLALVESLARSRDPSDPME
jgi:two-component system cell cycle response regulator DivK